MAVLNEELGNAVAALDRATIRFGVKRNEGCHMGRPTNCHIKNTGKIAAELRLLWPILRRWPNSYSFGSIYRRWSSIRSGCEHGQRTILLVKVFHGGSTLSAACGSVCGPKK
jgi:hypothetical protein